MSFDKELQFLFVVLGFIISWRDVRNDVAEKKIFRFRFRKLHLFQDIFRRDT